MTVTSRDRSPASGWSDTQLVRACIDGDDQAWDALVERYKRLIFSVALKYRASPEDAADIFQAVCLELFESLPRLRKSTSLKAWLITVSAHQSFHWKRRHLRRVVRETAADTQAELPDRSASTPDVIEELERAQTVREALAALPERCRELARMLFFEQPPVPYREVARRLGLATGSIGFIRARCLKRLQTLLEKRGL